MKTSCSSYSRRSFLRSLVATTPIIAAPALFASPSGIEAPAWTLYMSDNFFRKPFKTVRFRGNKLPINVWDYLPEDKGFAMIVVRESDGLRHIYFPPPRRFFDSDEKKSLFDDYASNFQQWARMKIVKVINGSISKYELATRYNVGGFGYSVGFNKEKETVAVIYDAFTRDELVRECYLSNEKLYLGFEA